MLRLLRAAKALLFPFAFAVLLLGLQAPAQAQSKPFPDMNEQVANCKARFTDVNCQIQGMRYIDKPPSDTGCPAYPCEGGPGRYQEVRIINPPGSQYEYFIWSAIFVPDDVIVKLTGGSITKALPAGPALPQKISTTQGRYPYPRASAGLQMDGGNMAWFTTNQAGEAGFNFVPPDFVAGTFHLKASCTACVNTDEKDIVVAACDICQGKGNPIAPGSGEKLQTESLWQDGGTHPLDFSLSYRSFGAAQAGLGSHWSHGYAATMEGGTLSQLVRLGSGAKFVFNRRDEQSPWIGDTGADTLVATSAGLVFTRAGDESRWQFDLAGRLVTITQRNGWAMTLGYTGGNLSRVTNAFGRSLNLGHDATGRLVSVTPPGAAAITLAYDAASRLASVRLPDGTSRAYVYENGAFPKALTGIFNESAYRYATFGYDARGRANLTQHDGGAGAYAANYTVDRVATFTGAAIDPAAYRHRVQVITPLGQYAYYDYQGGDGSVRMVGVDWRESAEDVASRTTGPGNLPTSESDFLGNVTTFSWDTGRKLLLSTTAASNKPEARTTQTEWHPTLRLPVRVAEAGRSTVFTYDAAGNKLSEAVTDVGLAQTRTTRWTYDANSLVASMTDARGGVWLYTHDTAGNRTGVRNPLGQQTMYVYDTAGHITRQTAPNGLVTTFTWDARGRLLSQSAAGESTTYSYTPNGQVASASQPNGAVATYAYDNAQRLTGASDNRGNRISYTLDAAGNRLREEVRDASGTLALLTTRVVNSLNLVSQMRGGMGQATQRAYNANGQPVAETDPLSQTTRQTLDGLGRATATTFADSTAASQAWSQLDQLTAVTDPKGVKTTYETNAFGDVVSETSPDIGTVRFEHDALGHLLKKTDARGIVTTWTRDALGRATEVRHGDAHVVLNGYDAAGQAGYLGSVEDNSGTTRYERDAFGRVTKKTQTVNDNPASPSSFSTSYGYAAGELASIAYPSGFKVTYRRDATGLITGIDTQAPGRSKPVNAFVSNLAWTALGAPRSWTWSNGDAARRTFDADGRMTGNEFATYTWDAASRITGITQGLFAQGTGTVFITPLSFTAGYDSRNRLTSFSRDGAETRYTYDANSNRLTALDRTTSDTDLDGDFGDADFARATGQALAIDPASNKLLGFTQTVVKTSLGATLSTVVTPVNYSLDANGALTSDGLRSFEYDDSNRLAEVKLTKNGEAASVSYLYNAMGQRVFKSEIQVAQTLPDETTLGVDFVTWLRSQFKWMFVRDQGNTSIGTAYTFGDGTLPEWALLGEYDNGSATGAGRTEYIWLPTPDGAIPVGIFRNGNLFAIHTDHLGTPRLMTNEAKAPVWQWPYSAFGNNKPTGVLIATEKPKQAVTIAPVMLKATAPVELNSRMPGQYFDVETGGFYNYFRHYDPRTGRYMQIDPIGLAGGLNSFAYVGINPLSRIDPLGLQAIIVPAPSRRPTVVDPDFPPGAGPNHQSDSALRDLIERNANRREYKNACNEPPPPGLNACERAKWELKKWQSCKDLREANTNRWWGGKDTQHDVQLMTDIDANIFNAKRAIRRICKEECP